jgi:SAM-dependent methyltransferase
MKQFKDFITEDISANARKETKLLVDTVYSKYIEEHDKNTVECVGWLDGHENALIRFQKIYEAGIDENDSVLDVGCGVAHFYTYLKRDKEWNGKYLGIDPNKKAIDLIDEDINAMHGTIDGLPDFMKYDWVIASGIFNLGLKEEHTFWIIENMISRANKGIIFNMLLSPYEDDKYEAYNPMWIHYKLQEYDHKKIEIIERYMEDDAEFTVYFYKENK